mmetsp:Transcript_32106/g.52355  ORF Transcript_32106/g.52355 Transcript_32106/m.52355 type:complete len:284 (+) Transcript_32106:33-884(+)
MISEGRNKIGAAKQRLATAKAHEVSASRNKESAKVMLDMAMKNMETVKKHSEAAESQFQSSQKEIQDADKFLKEAEKRWEVIDVDYDGDEKEKESRKKRTEASTIHEVIDVDAEIADNVRHPNGNANSETGRTTAANHTEGRRGFVSDDELVIGGTGNEDDSVTRFSNDADYVNTFFERITVEGCGLTLANGPYERSTELINGFPYYMKKGWWGGKTEDFVIFRTSNYWFIGIWHGGGLLVRLRLNSCAPLYRSLSSTNTELPPGNGWIAVGYGISPAPKSKW